MRLDRSGRDACLSAKALTTLQWMRSARLAGYSRGAFYSNFDDKEQVFLAVIDRRRPNAIDDIFQQSSEPAERIAAVREWFSNQWRLKDFIALRMEFSRRATRDRSVRKHLAELRRQELETYAGSVSRYLCLQCAAMARQTESPADRPEVVALVLLAVAHGLGSLAIETGPEWEHIVHGGRQAGLRPHDRAPKSLTEDNFNAKKQYLFSLIVLGPSCGAHVVRQETQAASEQPAVPVQVRTPAVVERAESVSASGSVEGSETADVAFQVGGRVARVLVEEGQHVNKGQLLAEIEPTDYRNAFNAATGAEGSGASRRAEG